MILYSLTPECQRPRITELHLDSFILIYCACIFFITSLLKVQETNDVEKKGEGGTEGDNF